MLFNDMRSMPIMLGIEIALQALAQLKSRIFDISSNK
jgi:hypothetical protein